MRQIRQIMGMPVILEIVDKQAKQADFDQIFEFLVYIDEKFSTYKKTSEISRINRGEIEPKDYSDDIKLIFKLAKQTKKETGGYFNIGEIGNCDPSGIVKGWAMHEAAKKIAKKFNNYYLEIAGDIQVSGHDKNGQPWRIGIINPLNKKEIIKVVELANSGIATSGNYERGAHIYNPKTGELADKIASLTVIGPNIYEADRFATAGFAMGESGISFIDNLPGLDCYMVNKKGVATMTAGFSRYLPVHV